jgi:hypothetical protein
LIKKVSSAVSGVFKPWQIKRVAEAKAEASLIKANTEIEIEGLRLRAMNRFIEEEANKQENMEERVKLIYHLTLLFSLIISIRHYYLDTLYQKQNRAYSSSFYQKMPIT